MPFVVATLENARRGNVSGSSCLSSEAETNPTRERGERNSRSIVPNFQNALSPELADARGARPRSRVGLVVAKPMHYQKPELPCEPVFTTLHAISYYASG